jgi:hypothetical protein
VGGSRQRFAPAAGALAVLGAALLIAIPVFGTRDRHHDGACSYEVVSRAPLWLWFTGLTCLVLANGAITYTRGREASDTAGNRVIARALVLALVVAVVWFALAQWGYEHINCEY